MSAAEVIEQIKKLPRAEQLKVTAFVRAAESAGVLASDSVGEVGEDFKQMADEMFTTNAELFRKLAQ